MITSSHLVRKKKKAGSQKHPAEMTPPMATRSRSSTPSSFDDEDVDEAYFAKTYVPLSSLPTPPLSSHSHCSRQISPESLFSAGEVLDPELLGPAVHLTNLIPSSTSLTTPSVALVHAILTRADLPLEMIALAVCILDSLNSRFARQWRKGCPLVRNVYSSTWADAETTSEQHIDSVHPEIIVLGALVLAVKFLDDAQQHTKEYATDWGKGLWTCDQINYTQRALLENLGYRLLPLWENSIILEALEDMERAGQQYRQHSPETTERNEDWDVDSCFGDSPSSGLGSNGKAVLGLGQQMTPAETPLAENSNGTRDVSKETRTAFQTVTFNDLQLLDRNTGPQEPFPAFINPALRGLEMGLAWGV